MKILFLDIDGVLNSRKYWSTHQTEWASKPIGYGMIDVDAVAILNKIIEATGAKIVISSSWRLHFKLDELTTLLKNKNLVGEIIGETPRPWLKDGSKFSSPIFSKRGEEIKKWITDSGVELESFVILDDNDIGAYKKQFVRTTWADGITEQHALAAIEILQNPIKKRKKKNEDSIS